MTSGTYSPTAERVLREGAILAPGESPNQMVVRVREALLAPEHDFGTSTVEVRRLRDTFDDAVEAKLITMGTPLLTNAGHPSRPLSSCAAIPVQMNAPAVALQSVEQYYKQNMGSGFDLSENADPVGDLLRLNDHAAQLTAAQVCERYIGNMANLDVDHPDILDFVRVKSVRDDLLHFNLSVNVTGDFMAALEGDGSYLLKDGRAIRARQVWDAIVEGAWRCGDPGLLFLDRYNADNPTPNGEWLYRTTAPCAEVPLAPGETCVFGYINAAALLDRRGVDLVRLRETVRLLVRLLDNAVELSLDAYASSRSRIVMASRRKIGIGICGYADLLGALQLPYGSSEARGLLRDILLSMTYESKVASVELAKSRGAFPAFGMSWFVDRASMSEKYVGVDSRVVCDRDWAALDHAISRHGIRNVTTTALPPTGRSAHLVDASTSIEPWFSLLKSDGEVIRPFGELLARRLDAVTAHAARNEVLRSGSCQSIDAIPVTDRLIFRNAAEISPDEHLATVSDASRCVDDGASKTVNLPSTALPSEVDYCFRNAWNLGMKAISIYRDRSRSSQPEQLVAQSA